MERISKTVELEKLDSLKRRALKALSGTDLASVYDATEIEKQDSSIDTAIKVILAEKLVDSIKIAKRYARRARMKRVGASAILIASQKNRW